MVLHDFVSIQLVREDYDHVLEEYFSDKEQFIVYTRNQDYDLDTCMDMCDTVAILNENTTETRFDMLSAQYDFKMKLQNYEPLPSVEEVEQLNLFVDSNSINESNLDDI